MKRSTKQLTAHNVNHVLCELMFLSLLICPFAIVLTVVVGLLSWTLGGVAAGLRASGITWGATMVLVPIVIRICCGPDTRVGCEDCALKSSLPKSH